MIPIIKGSVLHNKDKLIADHDVDKENGRRTYHYAIHYCHSYLEEYTCGIT